MAKAVEDTVAVIVEFLTDFEGAVPTWFVLCRVLESKRGMGGIQTLGGIGAVSHLKMMRNKGICG